MSKPTDIEVLSKIYEDFPIESSTLVALHKRLRDIVGKAQNGPPHGDADGTIDAVTWKRARLLASAMNDFAWAVDCIESDGDPDDFIPF